MVTDHELLDGLPARMSEESLRKRLGETCALILQEAPEAAPAVLERMAVIWGSSYRGNRIPPTTDEA